MRLPLSPFGSVASMAIVTAIACAATDSGTVRSDSSAATSSVADTVTLVPTLDGKLRAPAGFTVTYFAQNLNGPRMMALAPDGAVLVTIPEGQVVRLVDTNGDGKADQQTAILENLKRPSGIAVRGDDLYIALNTELLRVKLGADGRPVGTPAVIGTYAGGRGHWTRTVIFGADGGIYVSVGSSCNICVEKSSDLAAVVRFDENGGNKRVFSSGLRNAVGLALNPTTKEIWATQNERDNLAPNHENLPPEEINILRDGGDYGWPYCYTAPDGKKPEPNPEYGTPERCAKTIPAALPMQAHSAPLGISFLDRATKFPAAYRGDALVAFHGSWNRDVPTGAKLVRIRVKGGKPTAAEDFVVGWQRANGERWGRPVDVLVARDGSVLVSDDEGGVIYRITH